jgi:CTD small phosphatase-like protein 2
VLDTLDPDDEIFSKRYYREQCTPHPSLGVYAKDLSLVVDDRDLKRVVLVDNNPMSFLTQPSNGVLVSNFCEPAPPPSAPPRSAR